jgi:effector-binding domain-containing protein
MIKIGDFSKLSQVPVKTLRFYDQIELFIPAHVDKFSGYRYYTVDQMPRLNRILVLKDLNFTLDQITGMLDDSLTPEQMRGMLRLKQAEIERDLDEEQARLRRIESRLSQIEQENQMPQYEVLIKKADPIKVAAIRDTLPNYASIGQLINEAFGKLGIAPAGPPIAIYHDKEFKESDVDVEAAVPITSVELPQHERLKLRTLPGVEQMASLLHQGSYDDFVSVYQVLMTWIETNGYQVAGPSREIYLRGPESGEDPSNYMTEVQLPVSKK